jgi:MFS family permease
LCFVYFVVTLFCEAGEPSMGKEEAQGKVSSLHPTVKASGWVSLFTDFSSDMIVPLLPLFLKSVLMSSMGFIGLIEGAAETTASVLKLCSGYISDRLRRRKALVLIGYSLSSIARPLMAATQGGWHVLGLRITDRIGKGIRTSPRDALIADCTPAETRGLAFGYQRAMDNTGAIIGPLVGAGLLWIFQSRLLFSESLSFRLVFAIAAIPGLLVPFIIVRYMQDAPQPAAASPVPPHVQRRPLGGKFWAYMTAVLIFTLGNSSDAFLILRANQAGVPDWQVPLLWAAFNALRAFGSLPGGRLSDRIGRKPMIFSGWIIYAISYLLFGSAGAAWQIWAIMLLYGAYYGCVEGSERALVSDLVAPELRGTAYGIFNGALGLASLPASLLFGLVWQWTGRPLPAFLMGAALAGLAAMVLFFVTPAPAHARRQPA